jgi:NADPH-dependent 2,4-dienoyl-CoA reductase/sulfur reductase-like enzyme
LSTVQGASPRQIVVIGNGMVGARFAEEVARLDPQGERVRVSVVGTEEHAAYNRVLLSGVVAGTYTPEQIRLPVPVEVQRPEHDPSVDRLFENSRRYRLSPTHNVRRRRNVHGEQLHPTIPLPSGCYEPSAQLRSL